ncbi:hypothetical protein HF1_12430 [Mycoplasma haemofelis str. Langford 1]|uniref:Uncharacterized protein n=1 Tax=Mycoplasma haemofelis (strain Langford 1) TaxID=941640 RepID=E8ZJD0_MYCHL|nr:hypothetical protein [Mycoplasma haemofelis]CBY93251.1 hypothetical protein HF1_12430 [Mycoplasma haemofelis str. Langford 1]
MSIKVKTSIAGILTSLIFGIAGTYFYFTQESDIDRVLNLDLQSTSKKGRCKVRVQGIGGNGTEQTFSYSDFYKEGGDKRGMIAGACLKKLTKVDKNREDAVAVMEKATMGIMSSRKWELATNPIKNVISDFYMRPFPRFSHICRPKSKWDLLGV